MKTWKSCFLAVYPCRWLTCSELWCRFRNMWLQAWLILLVLHRSPCKILLSSILYELLSEIYRGKTSEMSQARSHVFLNLRHNSFQTKEDWCEWWTKMAASLNVFETSNKDCILSKSICFFTEVYWRYIESDKKIKLLTIRAL